MPKDITPTIETAMSAEEVSTRTIFKIYLNQSFVTDGDSEFAEAGFITLENGYYVFHFLANDTKDLIIDGVTYKCISVDRGTLEASQDGKTESISMKLSNNNSFWANTLAIVGRWFNGQKCIVYDYFPDFPNEEPAYFFGGVINNLKMSVSTFQFDVEKIFGDYDHTAPVMTYEPNCQFRFKSVKCGYTGSASRCDYTLNTCLSYHNELNFGGHPSIPREQVIK